MNTQAFLNGRGAYKIKGKNARNPYDFHRQADDFDDWNNGYEDAKEDKARAKTALWEVVDHKGDVVFSSETVAKEPAVKRGLYTPRQWALKLAKESGDPENPPLQARLASLEDLQG